MLSISYNKLLELLKKRELSIYKLKNDKVIGGATLDKIRMNEGHIDTRVINNICAYLDCQPGDIMEYVKDE